VTGINILNTKHDKTRNKTRKTHQTKKALKKTRNLYLIPEQSGFEKRVCGVLSDKVQNAEGNHNGR